jgi:hypothetical protein
MLNENNYKNNFLLNARYARKYGSKSNTSGTLISHTSRILNKSKKSDESISEKNTKSNTLEYNENENSISTK